jgi:predicted Zn-dependent protease
MNSPRSLYQASRAIPNVSPSDTVSTRSASYDIDAELVRRRVLSRETALTIGRRLLDFVSNDSLGISIEHRAHAITRIAGSDILNIDDGDRVRVRFHTRVGSGIPIDVSATQLDDGTLQRIVTRIRAMSSRGREDPVVSTDSGDPQSFTYNARPHPPVALWHDETIRAMGTARGEVLPELIGQLRASNLNGAATVGLAACSKLYLYQHGLTAFSEETDCEVTVTARTPDGTGSGWSGQANRNWTTITSSVVAERAIEIANRSRNPVALEPGRRVTILGPAAVASLVGYMALAFISDNIKGGTPFSFPNHDPLGRQTKIGMRVVDPRLRMMSDPADPDGGYPPFFEAGDDIPGFPTGAVTWIDRGVLLSLSYRVSEGVAKRMTPAPPPFSVRLDTVPGTRTATVDEMIANCEQGVYVNRFSNVQLLDMKTGMLTGVTRDGCFLIKHGKIEKPIKNLRFLDSPFFAFNKLEMIGAAKRVAFGHAPSPGRTWEYWPQSPRIVPPLMIQDFNFSALSDAV